MSEGAPRRFYKSASVAEPPSGFGVALDARTLKTPGGAPFVVPTRALAQACADEWGAQGEHVAPASMPLTQLTFAAIDWAASSREQRADYVASYAATDLCCHRAAAPPELVARQAAAWDPLVDWGSQELGVRLPVVVGVIAATVGEGVLVVLRARALSLDDFHLTALSQAVGLTGSTLIGFALLEGRLDAQAAFAAAALDDLWSLEKWGEDEEARARLVRLQEEIGNVKRFCESLSV